MANLTDQDIIDSHLAAGDELEPYCFPELGTLSDAHFFQLMPVAKAPAPPEIVYVPMRNTNHLEVVGVLASWNHLSEAAQFRGEIFRNTRGNKHLPSSLAWIKNLPAANIYLVADTTSKYDAYAPLYHLLPKHLLDRHCLPALKRPLWPTNAGRPWLERILSADFSHRLSNAFAEHIWRYLDSGSALRAFSATEPLALLSHNLDFWLPHAITMIEKRKRDHDREEPESKSQRRLLARARKQADPDITIERPRRGGVLWMGEDEAASVTQELVEAADRNGRLRSIIDAVRSNRIIDDFSSRWSFAREDFERKLYSRRSRLRVSFVELKDTLPVHSSRSEYTDDLLWQDFTALLDKRERHVIVCLRSGTTKLTEIAAVLGYANHSPVSKALARIRKKAAEFLN